MIVDRSNNKFKKLLSDAEHAQKKGRFEESIGLYKKILVEDPNHNTALNNLAVIYIMQARYDLAEEVIMKVMETSEDAASFNHLAIVYMRTSRLTQSAKLLEHALALDPFKLETFLNLANAYGLLKDYQKAFHFALEGVKCNPTSSFAFNNLGTVLSQMAKFEEAEIAYQTAVDLDANNIEAFVNLGSLQVMTGKEYLAIDTYETALNRLKKTAGGQIDVIKFLLSFEYLKAGNLSKGWEFYDSGFHPSVPSTSARTPPRSFKKPRWNGQPITGKTLLVWREQGLGDEMMFMSCLPELLKKHDKIIVEVDRRLVDVVQRSFPTIHVRAQNFGPAPHFEAVSNDFDYHVPLGSLMRYFRPTLEHFKTSGPFIQVDPEKKAKFADRLSQYKGKKLIGICWRSGVIDHSRAMNYTSLKSWGSLLSYHDAVWVNLQYGECEAECVAAEQSFGIEILRWEDLNLKDDLDDVLALIDNLDFVVTVTTAVHHMGASVGAETKLLTTGRAWNRFGLDYDPWFPNLQPFVIVDGSVDEALFRIRASIEGHQPTLGCLS